MLRFFWLIRYERFHYKHAFIEKAQHLWRWISLRTFTRGRLVPRRPRAIKRTTRTELHHEGIYIAKYIHWNNGIIPAVLCDERIYIAKFIHWDNSAIPTQLRDETIVVSMMLIIKRKMSCGKQVHNLTLFTAWNNRVGVTKYMFQHHRCCVFDSPGLPNDSAGYPGLMYVLCGTTP